MENLSSERNNSEHVQWQTSSQESRDYIPPATPCRPEAQYEESMDFTAALLDKYEPVLGSSPPATWHPKQVNSPLNVAPVLTQPAKRTYSDVPGRFYRFSPGNLKANNQQSSKGSPRKKFAPILQDEASINKDSLGTLCETGDDTLKEATPSMIPPSFSDSEEEETSIHPDLQVYWQQPDVHRFIVYSVTKTPEVTTLWCRDKDGFKTIELVKSWADTPVKADDIVNVVGLLENGVSRIVVDKTLLFIVQPDILVPATTIADSFKCDRQVLLRQRVRFLSAEVSLPLIYGNIIHETLQSCLIEMEFSPERLTELFAILVEDYIEDLVLIDKPLSDAMEELKEKIPEIMKWVGLYIRDKPDYEIPTYRSSQRKPFAVQSSKYTELEIWSPRLGLMGKIDSVLQVLTGDGPRYVGFEIKTGKFKSNGHRAQSSLYALLMQERFGYKAAPYTVLYYSSDNSTSAIPALPDEVRALIQKRNSLVRYLKDPFQLAPPVNKDPLSCKTCFVRSACTVYAIAYQELDSLSSVEQVYHEIAEEDTKHLSGTHLEFLEHWDTALTQESLEMAYSLKRVWCEAPEVQEKKGETFFGLKVVKLVQCFSDGVRQKFIYELNSTTVLPHRSRITTSSPIFICSAKNLCLASGYVRSIGGSTLQIATGQYLDQDATVSVTINESKQFISYSRGNLLGLFSPNQQHLLSLIVDLKKPSFEQKDVEIPKNFNDDQSLAIKMVLNSNDYTLIRGMPGTGKTTTIVALAQLLAKEGKSVLIAGYTNSSVDNIVLKLMRKGAHVLRLGNSPASIHKDVLEVAACEKSPRSKEELEEIYMKPNILATTSLSLQSWILRKREFDYCIVDEASQLTLPACLGTLSFARKFVLVGDDHQLSPLVKSDQARAAGLDISLFKRLADAHPEAVVNLTAQYRMNQDIMRLSSELVYEGLLKCGTREVAEQKLTLPRKSPFIKTPPWLDTENSVVFLNTDPISNNCESQTSDGVYNTEEIKITRRIVTTFIKNGVDPTRIGVISVYREQVQRLEQALGREYPTVEVLTADKAQGRDKDCIIISLVRSNTHGGTGRLLHDWRRINVVFTRAKCKLVIIGSRKTLKSASALEKFIKVIESHNWIYNVD